MTKEELMNALMGLPVTYGVTNPEEHYITCEKKNYRGLKLENVKFEL